MKLLIASDIHGSAVWCKKLVDAFMKEGADKLVLLGDILYHGPRNPLPDGYSPKDVFGMLNPLADRIIAVRGNCDSEVDQMVLAFNISSDYGDIFADGVHIAISHGHRTVPPLGKGDVYITGHTHVPLTSRLRKERAFYTSTPARYPCPKRTARTAIYSSTAANLSLKTLIKRKS